MDTKTQQRAVGFGLAIRLKAVRSKRKNKVNKPFFDDFTEAG